MTQHPGGKISFLSCAVVPLRSWIHSLPLQALIQRPATRIHRPHLRPFLAMMMLNVWDCCEGNRIWGGVQKTYITEHDLECNHLTMLIEEEVRSHATTTVTNDNDQLCCTIGGGEHIFFTCCVMTV
mmetsp:Transcript_18882/g.31308  ORF Transcript_18882/g.31308 Transcript_18882/m.31308 type:complete len:126 (+) Transcript_18882:397-774(+)